MLSVQSSVHPSPFLNFTRFYMGVSVHWLSLFHGSFTNLTKGMCLHDIKVHAPVIC